MKTVSVILPTYNEKENILTVIESLKKNIKNPLEILVVDDNSPDRTWEIVEKFGFKDVKVIRRMRDRSLPKSIAEGIRNSSGNIIVWMDADMSHPPEIVPRLVEETENYDVAIASRYIEGGKDTRPFVRRFTSRIMNLFSSFFLGFKVTDWDSGFVAANSKVFDKVNMITRGYGQYCINFLYLCIRNGFAVKEVGFVNVDRKRGSSKTYQSFLGMLGLGYDYTKEILRLRWGG